MILRNSILLLTLLLFGCDTPHAPASASSPNTVSTQSNGLMDHVITSMAGGAAAGAAGGAAHAAVSHGLQRWQANRRLSRIQSYRASRH